VTVCGDAGSRVVADLDEDEYVPRPAVGRPNEPGVDLDAIVGYITHDQLTAMRKCMPDLMFNGRTSAVLKWGSQLEQSLLHHPDMFKSVKVRDEAVLTMLKFMYVGRKLVPQPTHKGAAGAAFVSKHANAEIGDDAVNQEAMQWLLAPGSEIHPEARVIAIGRVLSVLAYEVVRDYPLREISQPDVPVDSETLGNLAATLLKLSIECAFDRTVDWYLHAAMRTKLQAAQMGYLKPSLTPMRAIPVEYKGEDTIRIVRGFMRFSPSARFEAADWKTDYSIDLFVTCVALLREIIDDVTIPLCTNSEIVCHRDHKIPAPFVLNGNFSGDLGTHIGYVYQDELYAVKPDIDHPVLRTVLAWCKRCIEVTELDGGKSAPFRSFYNAAVSPDRVLPGDKYSKFFRV
jgi:hypothetical protein